MQSRLRCVRETYDSVPFGVDIVSEYVMYNLGVPFSKRFMPDISRVWAERYRRVMKGHSEFSALRDQEQAAVWLGSTFDAVALTIVRQESAADGTEQVAAAFGAADAGMLRAQLAGTALLSSPGARLRKVCLSDVNNQLKYVDAHTYRRIYEIIGELQQVQQSLVALFQSSIAILAVNV